MDPPDCSGPDCKQNCPYQQYPVSLLAGLQDLRNADNFSDITIRVGEKTFKGHRVVLAASSPYFRAMFTGGLSETNKKEVKIETIEAETFSLLLDFIYQGSITLTTDNCQEVLIAANLLQLTALMHKCIVFLSNKLDPSNVSDVINFAIALDMPVLHKTAEDMALSRFREVFWRTEFLTLSEKTVIEIFKSENIAVCHESEVLEAAVLYLEHHYSKNPRIMDTIRLTLIANKNRNEIIERIQSKELKEEIAVITKKVKTHVMSYDTPLMEQPRIMASRKIYVLGGEKESGWDATPLNSLDCLDLDTKEWQETVQFETKDDDGLIKLDRSLFGVAVLFADIFVIGGEKDGQVFDNVETYNTITSM